MFVLFSHSFVYAQRIAMPTTPVSDSIKARRLSKNKMKVVDGIAMGTARDIVENLRRVPQFSTLFSAIKTAGLIETFKSKGPITLFAPENSAFAKLPRGTWQTLLKPDHNLELSAFITCHAIPGEMYLKDIIKKIKDDNGKTTYTTVGGCKLTATLDAQNNVIITDEKGNQAMITAADIDQSNGLIHVINSVLIPKPKTI